MSASLWATQALCSEGGLKSFFEPAGKMPTSAPTAHVVKYQPEGSSPILGGDQEVLAQAFRVLRAVWSRFSP
jgi:hypothetical protein